MVRAGSVLICVSKGRGWLVRAGTIVSRLEKELEERRLKEREELLSELESMRRTAQDEMDRQQMEYQDKIQELSKIMVEGQ